MSYTDEYMANVQRTLQIGDYVSPGLYMEYWGAIVRKYSEQKAFSLNELKQYKEMRVGAILAALWTSTMNEKWFVGMPHDEPADMELLRVMPTVTRSGREAFGQEIIPVQVTRCSAPVGEDIITQIQRKNKPALTTHTLVVDVSGDGQKININDIAKRLSGIGDLYPHEIAILATVGSTSEPPFVSTYLQFLLHPNYRKSTIKSSDTKAFFVEPTIINLRRGISRNFSSKSKADLLLP